MVFMFIFVIIIIGFLLTGGVSLVMKFFGIGSDVQIERQAREFELTVYSKEKRTGLFWTTTGSTENFNFFVGDDVERACFFDPVNPADNPSGDWVDEYDYADVIKAGGYSLAYFRRDKGLKGYIVEKLKPSENFCISTTTKLLFTNKGSYVEVRPA